MRARTFRGVAGSKRSHLFSRADGDLFSRLVDNSKKLDRLGLT